MGAKYTAAQAKAAKKHLENFDQITVRLPKGEREEWKAFVEYCHYGSMNEFIVHAMEYYKKSIIEDFDEWDRAELCDKLGDPPQIYEK